MLFLCLKIEKSRAALKSMLHKEKHEKNIRIKSKRI